MGSTLQLTAADGHGFDLYRAEPPARPRGALVIAQEIFGVNGHIRAVCDGYAAGPQSTWSRRCSRSAAQDLHEHLVEPQS